MTSATLHWDRWNRLPREARDTLFLLGVIAWTVLPHTQQLPVWCSVLAGTVLLWRAHLAFTSAPLPSRWTLLALMLLAGTMTWWTFRTVIGKDPGITMVVVLMTLKTLELRARRDAFVVFFLGFFLVLTQFLYSQSIGVAAIMLVSVWGLLTSLVLAHMPVGQPSLSQAAKLALRTALMGLPLMALLFVLFPRVGPLWNVPPEKEAVTGLSNTMRMGNVAELAADDSIAMRVRFIDPPPPRSTLYFRGPVLSRFDGVEWTAAETPFIGPQADVRVQGPALRYEVTLEPLRLTAVPLLEFTNNLETIEGTRVGQRADLVWRADRPVTQRLRFTASAHTSFSYGGQMRPGALREFTQLPEGYNPRTLAWAKAFAAGPELAGADPIRLARAVFARIRNEAYGYTLTPGLYGEADPKGSIDEFWLDRKLGFCEHFAGAFVVVMRAMGVPARVVTGYQGTDADPVDGYYVVRQSHAHAWAEFWQPGLGWVRADPTTAVAPERVQNSRNLTPPRGFIGGAIDNLTPGFLTELRLLWETTNNRWNQWVLDYSRNRQLDLFNRLGFSAHGWQDMALLLVGVLSGLSLLGAGWAWWDRNRQDPWQRQAALSRRLLRTLGIESAAHDTPRTLAARLEQRFGDAATALVKLLDVLERQRYDRQALARPSRDWMRSWRHEVRQLRAQSIR
jgi:transglutaminase-like putative cysteine protease